MNDQSHQTFINLQSELMISDPFSQYDLVRSIDPIYWNAERELWYITGHAELLEAFREDRFSNSYQIEIKDQVMGLSPEGLAFRRRLFGGGPSHTCFADGRSLMTMDPPEHTAYRRMIASHFTPREVARFRPVVEGLVNGLLDRMQARSDADFMRDFAYELPVSLFNEILGVPEEQKPNYIDYEGYAKHRRIKSSVGTDQDYVDVASHGDRYKAMIDDLIAARKDTPGKDMITSLLTAQVGGCPMSQKNLYAAIYAINTGAHSTTTALLGNMIYYLRKYGLWEKIRDDQSLLPKVIEEVLRFDAPVHLTGREVKEDMEFLGHRMKKGDQVLLFTAAGNRDPRVFDRPNDFIHDRTPNPHLTFGLGTHFCIGAPYARLEAEIAMTTIFRRFPNLDLSGQPVRAHSIGFGFQTMPVKLH